MDAARIVHIHSVIILRRSDKTKDRVEISPEQLSAASIEAENDKTTKTGQVLYTCFQSVQDPKSSEYERIEIPIHVIPHTTIGKVCLKSAIELPSILCQEEQDAYRKVNRLTHLDSVTKIHNGSVFTKHLCSQLSAVSGPLLQWLENRLEQNQQRLQELEQEKEGLMEELSFLE
ncbi:hypothetical protein A6R68_18318 [Neotoma lepida]|uniref:BRCC36 C-terminal helical domain-containing protein n=1 Tax=Neotoma lepida TaxID=56216 RepID=A0A1A6HLD1_NEOLE|nr:hypothetical protein A6R68_18318 [Neotoma lepida]